MLSSDALASSHCPREARWPQIALCLVAHSSVRWHRIRLQSRVSCTTETSVSDWHGGSLTAARRGNLTGNSRATNASLQHEVRRGKLGRRHTHDEDVVAG